jgi:hypothetical protein
MIGSALNDDITGSNGRFVLVQHQRQFTFQHDPLIDKKMRPREEARSLS